MAAATASDGTPMSARRTKAKAGGSPPISTQKIFQRAVEHHRAGRMKEAAALYGQVLAMDPSYGAAWTNLGIVLRGWERFDAAIACYRRALEASPNDAGILGNLGNVLKDAGRMEESLAAHRRTVGLRPNDASARYNYGIALKQAADLEAALAEFEASLRLDPAPTGPPWDRALALLQLGRFDEGWPAYESRWRLDEHPPRPFTVPLWQGEAFAEKTLWVHPEQGFGDAIIASRFLPWAKSRGGRVVLECKPELARLFSGLDGVDRLIRAGEAVDDADLHCPVMSLLGLYGATLDNLPPPPRLVVPDDARSRFRPLFERYRDRFTVGVIWSGSATFKGNRDRSTRLERFVPLAEIPGVQLVSLQKGPQEAELGAAGVSGTLIIELGSKINDFAETAAVVEALDLVIMTDSATAHLAGSLGQPVWNLLNSVPYWMYGLEGETTPWYPSMRLFRQRWPGDWDGVFERVRTALAQAAADKRAGRWPG